MDNSATRSTHRGTSRPGFRRTIMLAVCFGLALTAIAARAETSAAAASTSDQNAGALEEIVVTAEFRNEKLQQALFAITALTTQALSERNIIFLVDVSNVAPNVTMF